STSGKSESPCSADVFTRIKRRNSTPPASTLIFCVCNMARSKARPKSTKGDIAQQRLGSQFHNMHCYTNIQAFVLNHSLGME
ncbi:hypothetical protein PHMEG_0005750, partial [Phytophthora megakarya]